MAYFRITITPTGPVSTEWVSGTVWGHMAWAVRYVEGESALEQWITEQEESPWLFSSGMPEKMVPRPLLRPSRADKTIPSLTDYGRSKKARKAPHIPESVFLALRNGLNEQALMDAIKQMPQPGSDGTKEHPVFHNQISRLSGRTLESDGLFVETTVWPAADHHFQIFAAADQFCKKRLADLLTYIGDAGFGANASTGRGSFKFRIEEETKLFEESGNRAMSLSHGVITPEMKNPRYKLHTHYGKLGGHFAAGGHSPFKYPVLMARPGATFDPTGPPPFGKLLGNVHHDESLGFIRHHALHLPIHFTEVTP